MSVLPGPVAPEPTGFVGHEPTGFVGHVPEGPGGFGALAATTVRSDSTLIALPSTSATKRT